MRAVIGEPLPAARALDRHEGDSFAPPSSPWTLHGVRSNERYTNSSEKQSLVAVQEAVGRPASTRAALIPIRKSDAWWALSQDERRAIFEEQSRHIALGMKVLPAVARRLYHARDIGEPFDFLTWFEYAPEHANAFEEIVGALRET